MTHNDRRNVNPQVPTVQDVCEDIISEGSSAEVRRYLELCCDKVLVAEGLNGDDPLIEGLKAKIVTMVRGIAESSRHPMAYFAILAIARAEAQL